MKTSFRISFLLWTGFLLLFIAGCSPYKKVAKDYVESPPGHTFLILKPDFLYKDNLKEYQIGNKDSLTEAEMDSILFFSSIYLKEIEDRVFIDTLVENVEKNLERFGFNIYAEDQMEEFMALQKPAYVVNIAQIVLEEYVYPYEAEAVIYDEVVSVKDIDLNALNINIWFELNPVNTENEAARVLFASDQIYDDMEGRFIGGLFGSDLKFEYTVDSLKMDEVYYAGAALGRKYAMYFNDYFLNRYILKNLPSGYNLEEYYHYNPTSGKIYPIDEEYRFIEMDLQ